MNIVNSALYPNGDHLFIVQVQSGQILKIRFDSAWNGSSLVEGALMPNHETGHTALEMIPEVVKAIFKSEALGAQVRLNQTIRVTKGFHQHEGGSTFHLSLYHRAVGSRHVYQPVSPGKTCYTSPIITSKKRGIVIASPEQEPLSRAKLQKLVVEQQMRASAVKTKLAF